MPLSPREAVVLTEQNLQEVEELCRAIDAWLRANRTEVDVANRVYLDRLGLRLPCRKVQWTVSARYRKAGWMAWFDADARRPFLYLAVNGGAPGDNQQQ